MAKTIFANVYATMLVDCSYLMLPVVNEMHGTSFSMEDEVVLSNEEHYLKNKDESEKRVSDSHFSIQSKGGAVPCASGMPDSSGCQYSEANG